MFSSSGVSVFRKCWIASPYFLLVGSDATHVEMGEPVIRPILDCLFELLKGIVQSALLLVQRSKMGDALRRKTD